ncbi:hypothetical protein [Jeotgalibacillus proteolyticus]|nr:hypothetical protein [Jeotgalibacillus proteolyticus]
MEILAREIVESLPELKRNLYQYIVNVEDSLAARSATSEQFMALLVKTAPHQQAAEHFGLSCEKVIMLMRQIEKDIDDQLNDKIKKARWMDKTEEMRQITGNTDEKKTYFLFTIER